MIIKGKLENLKNTVSFGLFAVLRWPVLLNYIDSFWLRRTSADPAHSTCWTCRQNRLFCVLLYSTFFNSLSHPHSLLWLLLKVCYGPAIQLPFLQRFPMGSSVRTETLSCLFSSSWNLWPVYSSSEKWHVQPKKRHFVVNYLSYCSCLAMQGRAQPWPSLDVRETRGSESHAGQVTAYRRASCTPVANIT